MNTSMIQKGKGTGKKILSMLFALAVAIESFVLNTSVAFAGSNLLDDTAAENTVTNILTKVCNLYQKWGILIIGLSAGEFLLSKDEKKKGVAKSVLIGALVAYVIAVIAGGSGIVAMVDTFGKWGQS